MAVQICSECGEHNAPLKRTCIRCGAILDGWTVNNVTGEYGYRSKDGTFTTLKEMNQGKIKEDVAPAPPVQVLVDVKKLREIEWCGHLCPVCDGVDPNWSMAIYVEADKKGHTPGCWLGNALKGADDEKRE